jgi:hypothetical protein
MAMSHFAPTLPRGIVSPTKRLTSSSDASTPASLETPAEERQEPNQSKMQAI